MTLGKLINYSEPLCIIYKISTAWLVLKIRDPVHEAQEVQYRQSFTKYRTGPGEMREAKPVCRVEKASSQEMALTL